MMALCWTGGPKVLRASVCREKAWDPILEVATYQVILFMEPCHNHRGKAPLTPASGLPIPSPKTGLTTQKLTAAQVPGNYEFKLPG